MKKKKRIRKEMMVKLMSSRSGQDEGKIAGKRMECTTKKKNKKKNEKSKRIGNEDDVGMG